MLFFSGYHGDKNSIKLVSKLRKYQNLCNEMIYKFIRITHMLTRKVAHMLVLVHI